MTALPAPSHDVRPPARSAAEQVRKRLVARVGDQPMSDDTVLTALGVDSLLLLRVMADLVSDPTQEIDPGALADLVTVGDLTRYVEKWR